MRRRRSRPAERERLAAASLDGAPAHVAGDFPAWLEPSFAAVFGARLVEETAALALRAPVDLRVNTLKGARDKALASLAHLNAAPTPLSPLGLRLPLTPEGRNPALAAEADYVKGRVEIQDEGSQLAALLSAAKPGEQVLDLCAGAGGKTLALAAMMQNKGQIYASDDDGRRLAPIYKRLERAGARNVQVRAPRRGQDALADLAGALRSRADRRALHRDRRVAAQSRRQMAHPARRAGAARRRPGRNACRRRPLRQAAGPHPLCNLLAAARRERGPRRRFPRHPS